MHEQSSYVCGGKLKIEPNLGDGDDSALNGIQFRFCPLKKLNYVDFNYDLTSQKFTTQPKVVKTSTFINPLSSEQKDIFSVTTTKSSESRWDTTDSIGVSVTVGAEFEIPFVGGGSVEV